MGRPSDASELGLPLPEMCCMIKIIDSAVMSHCLLYKNMFVGIVVLNCNQFLNRVTSLKRHYRVPCYSVRKGPHMVRKESSKDRVVMILFC